MTYTTLLATLTQTHQWVNDIHNSPHYTNTNTSVGK